MPVRASHSRSRKPLRVPSGRGSGTRKLCTALEETRLRGPKTPKDGPSPTPSGACVRGRGRVSVDAGALNRGRPGDVRGKEFAGLEGDARGHGRRGDKTKQGETKPEQS